MKIYPPGTFIPAPQRLMAILQLCLAFSLMLWYLVQPFMGEYFALRSRLLIYEYVMGNSSILKSRSGQEEKLVRQAERFRQLPLGEQTLIKNGYKELQKYAQRPIIQKIGNGIKILLIDIPPFEQAWMFFSILLAILILLKVEGAREVTWILPLIVIIFAIDNQIGGKTPYVSPDVPLFPSEQVIIENYLGIPFSKTVEEQKSQLEAGWKTYLIENWLPDLKRESMAQQEEEAEFFFTLARLKLLQNETHFEWLNRFHEKIGMGWLTLYFLWNCIFAWIMIRHRHQVIHPSKSLNIPIPAK